MKRQFICLLAFLVAASAFTLDVSKKELMEAGDGNLIEFINYNGPHKVIDSIQAIRNIGSGMGSQIATDITKPKDVGSTVKYKVIHAVDPNEKEKLDADILIIGPDATVDHIDNLRRIISAYLSSAYNYNQQDSDTLAVFITVYNAVYRQKMDIFKTKYKDVVTEKLSKDICGLSVNYEQWPGKSQIVIPLYDINNGGLSTVDTSVISDSKVVKSMKEDEDMNIASRKDMLDLKERESEQATENAKTAQKTAVEEQKKLDEEKKRTEEVKKQAEVAKQKADEKQAVADKNPESKVAKEEAKKAKEEAAEKQNNYEQQKQKEDSQKQKTEAAKDQAKQQQNLADKKQNESLAERKEIAQDQNEVQKKELMKESVKPDYSIVLTDEKKLYSRLVKFNSENGDIIKNSPVTVLRNRTIFDTANGFLAIAGENSKNGAVKLVLLDKETMEISKESEATVSENSVLVPCDGDFLCVVTEGSNNYLARYDVNLNQKFKSKLAVSSATPVTITPSGIVVTDVKGKLKILDKNLAEIN